MRLKATTLYDVKKRIIDNLGWEEVEKRPAGGEICVKQLCNRGIYTFIGMLGYCFKDETEPHFAVRTKYVSEESIADGKELHMLLGATYPKNLVQLTSNNIVDRALQFNRYRAKHPLSNLMFGCLKQMIRSGKYTASAGWLLGQGIDKQHSESLWTYPRSVSSTDIANIFFWQEHKRVNRYFEPKHPKDQYVELDNDDDQKYGSGDRTPDPSVHAEEMRPFIPLAEVLLRCGETLPDDIAILARLNPDF